MQTQTAERSTGTALPWTAFLLGASGSLAANLWDAAAKHLPHSGTPLPLALFFAALPPLALLLVVEMLMRSARTGGGLTWIMWTGAGVVGMASAVMSFGHMYMVARSLGQPALFAALMPLAVDGLLLVASVALARAARAGAPAASVGTDGMTDPEPAGERADDVPEGGTEHAPVPDAPAAPAARVPEPPAAPAARLPDAPAAVPETAEHPAVLVPPRADDAPEDMPESGTAEPSVPGPRSDADARELAREWIRAAFRDGRAVTGADVAAEHGRSERWGRLRLAEVRNTMGESA